MKYWWLYIEIPMVVICLYILANDIKAIVDDMRH